MMVDLRPTGISEPRSLELLVVIGRWGVAVSVFTSRRMDASLMRSTRHDDEESEGDEDKSKEVSSEGDFKRRHWRTPLMSLSFYPITSLHYDVC